LEVVEKSRQKKLKAALAKRRVLKIQYKVEREADPVKLKTFLAKMECHRKWRENKRYMECERRGTLN
jgi:hypothetical protein